MSDTLLGTIIIFAALGAISYLTFKSRKTIELIHKKKLNSAREIMKAIDEHR